jgi:hypothetical protein
MKPVGRHHLPVYSICYMHRLIGRSPWRPLLSGRITLKGANNLLIYIYVVVALLSFKLGVVKHFVIFTALVFWYNDFGGSDRSGLHRKFLNASGYACLFSGPVQIITGSSHTQGLMDRSSSWTILMVLLIFTTIHAQEFRDEVGDRARKRRTIISAVGNTWARLLLLASIILWSILIPQWLGLQYYGAFVTWVLGAWTSILTVWGISHRSVDLDKYMYLIWSCWLLSICPLPFVKALIGVG